MSFEVGGILKELLVVEAQKVNQGDVLAKLDQRDLQAKLKSARAQFDNADAEYQRALQLIKGDVIFSRSTLEQRKSQRDVSKAQLETAEKALQDTVLLAPYSGNIAAWIGKIWRFLPRIAERREPDFGRPVCAAAQNFCIRRSEFELAAGSCFGPFCPNMNQPSQPLLPDWQGGYKTTAPSAATGKGLQLN